MSTINDRIGLLGTNLNIRLKQVAFGDRDLFSYILACIPNITDFCIKSALLFKHKNLL